MLDWRGPSATYEFTLTWVYVHSAIYDSYLVYWFSRDQYSIGRGEQGQSGMKLMQCSGLPEIFGQLEGGGEVCLHWYLCICLYVKHSQYSGLA